MIDLSKIILIKHDKKELLCSFVFFSCSAQIGRIYNQLCWIQIIPLGDKLYSDIHSILGIYCFTLYLSIEKHCFTSVQGYSALPQYRDIRLYLSISKERGQNTYKGVGQGFQLRGDRGGHSTMEVIPPPCEVSPPPASPPPSLDLVPP